MIQQYIKKMILNYRIKKAIKEAMQLAEKTGRKHLVLMHRGRPKVFAKKSLQHLVRIKYFRKGTRIQDIERMALFITK